MKEELKKEHNDLEDMVFRMELTYGETEEILDTKYTATSSTGYTLPPGIFEIAFFDLMLKSFFPDEVKVKITNNDIRLRSNITTNKTIKFTGKSFFYTRLGFTQSLSGPLGVIKTFVQVIPGT